jgi:hypothetical protein
MYKRIDFTKLEGLATYQDTLEFLQASYRDTISTIARLIGSRVIVTGVTDQGATYSDGWVIIDGELMPLVGGLKSDRVIIDDRPETEVFSDGSIQTVYYTKSARLGVSGGYGFSEFIRADTVATISEGLKNLVIAHNNLQSAFNTHTHTWDQILNKPGSFAPSFHRTNWGDIDNRPPLLTCLYKDSYNVGDVWAEQTSTVYFNRDIGTTDYFVIGSWLSQGNANDDNDAFWVAKNKRSYAFDLVMKEIEMGSTPLPDQNLRFEYFLINVV